MKKVLSFILVLSLVLTLCVPTAMAADRYKDVGTNHWAYRYIDYLSGKNVLAGDGDGTFRPDAPVTRAEFIKMIVCTFGLTDVAPVSFTSVSAWALPYVQRAAAQGFLLSYPTNTDFSEKLSREEAVTLIMRYLQPDTSSVVYNRSSVTDINEVSAAYRTYVQEALYLGIISGYNDGTFKPRNTLTRAEALAVLYAAAGRIISNANAYDFNAPMSGVTINGDAMLFEAPLAGNILITEGARIVSLMNCRLSGTIYVRGATKLTLSGVTASEIVVLGNAQLSLTNGASASAIKFSGTSTLDIDEKSTVKNVYFEAAAVNSKVTGKGSIGKLWVNAKGVTSESVPSEYYIANKLTAVFGGVTYNAGTGKASTTGITSAAVYGTFGSGYYPYYDKYGNYFDYFDYYGYYDFFGNYAPYDCTGNTITIKVVPEVSGTVYAAAWRGDSNAYGSSKIMTTRTNATSSKVTAGNTYYLTINLADDFRYYNVGLVMASTAGASTTAYLPLYNSTSIGIQSQPMGTSAPAAYTKPVYPAYPSTGCPYGANCPYGEYCPYDHKCPTTPGSYDMTWSAYAKGDKVYITFDQPMYVYVSKLVNKSLKDGLDASLFTVAEYQQWTPGTPISIDSVSYDDKGYFGGTVTLTLDSSLDSSKYYYIGISKLLVDVFGNSFDSYYSMLYVKK